MKEESKTKTASVGGRELKITMRRAKRIFSPAQREEFVKQFERLGKGEKKQWLLFNNLTYTQLSRWIKAKSQPGVIFLKRHNPDSPNPPVFNPEDSLKSKEAKLKSADKLTHTPDIKPLPWKIPPKIILSNPIGDHSIGELNYLVKENERLTKRNLLLEGMLDIQERVYRLLM